MQILCELSDSSHYQIIPLNLGTDAETELFQAIRNQIQNHHGHISRQELETTLSYSGSYLNRIVKKYTGYSIKQYALSISLKEAVDLLQSTDMPVNEICNTLHFSNLTYFFRKNTEQHQKNTGKIIASRHIVLFVITICYSFMAWMAMQHTYHSNTFFSSACSSS